MSEPALSAIAQALKLAGREKRDWLVSEARFQLFARSPEYANALQFAFIGSNPALQIGGPVAAAVHPQCQPDGNQAERQQPADDL